VSFLRKQESSHLIPPKSSSAGGLTPNRPLDGQGRGKYWIPAYAGMTRSRSSASPQPASPTGASFGGSVPEFLSLFIFSVIADLGRLFVDVGAEVTEAN